MRTPSSFCAHRRPILLRFVTVSLTERAVALKCSTGQQQWGNPQTKKSTPRKNIGAYIWRWFFAPTRHIPHRLKAANKKTGAIAAGHPENDRGRSPIKRSISHAPITNRRSVLFLEEITAAALSFPVFRDAVAFFLKCFLCCKHRFRVFYFILRCITVASTISSISVE